MKTKKIIIIGIIAIFAISSFQNISSIKTQNEPIKFNEMDIWTGTIRIEGELDTIWEGKIDVGSVTINALNVDTQEVETHELTYPSILGALYEASQTGGFTIEVQYFPTWDSLYVSSINGEVAGLQTGWNYWVDYEAIMVGADSYELTNDDSEILWGFLYYETWETNAHTLKISINEEIVKEFEVFSISVFDEQLNPVEESTVFIGSDTYETDENGVVKASVENHGSYNIFAEKEPTTDDTYLRSCKQIIAVEESIFPNIIKLIESIIEIIPNLEPILRPLIDYL